MGGCATKPKADSSTAPAPEMAKEDISAAAVESVTEVTVDEDNKRQSLSNLFRENEGEEPIEVVETPTETKDLEEIKEIENSKDISEGEAQEHEKIEKSANQTPRDVVEVPLEAQTGKLETIQAIIETPEPEETKTETTEEDKIIEEEARPKEEKVEEEKIIEEEARPKEEKVEEEKLATETQVAETLEEKIVVEVPVEETKSPEIPVERKTEEEK